MPKTLILLAVLLAACTATKQEVFTTSVDVDQSMLPALLQDIDTLAGNSLAVDKILELAKSTPMDDELQDRYAFVFNGSEEEIQIHIWREQVGWVHLYFSSTSKELITALEKTNTAHARDDDT